MSEPPAKRSRGLGAKRKQDDTTAAPGAAAEGALASGASILNPALMKPDAIGAKRREYDAAEVRFALQRLALHPSLRPCRE